jgi:hypothetical protein
LKVRLSKLPHGVYSHFIAPQLRDIMPPKLALVSHVWLVLAAALPGSLWGADLEIEHVTIVSPERDSSMRDARIRVHDGRIVAISKASGASAPSKGIAKLDGSDLFLAPGLIDSHVHLGQIPGMRPDQEGEHPDIAAAARNQIPRSYLLYGFTTLIDLTFARQAGD